MHSKTKRKGPGGLPQDTIEYLKSWMMSPEHCAHPYPTEEEKEKIMADTGIGYKQLTNWMVNNRRRYWKPRMIANAGQSSKSKRRRASRRRQADPAVIPLEGRDVISSYTSTIQELDHFSKKNIFLKSRL